MKLEIRKALQEATSDDRRKSAWGAGSRDRTFSSASVKRRGMQEGSYTHRRITNRHQL